MRKLTLIASSLLLCGLVACNSNEITNPENPSEPENPSTPENPSENTEYENVFLVYFSATGNTENVANYIASHLNIVAHELLPVDPYTSEDLNYNNSSSRVSIERNNPDTRRVELEEVNFEGFSEADLVILGFPVWWGAPSWVVDEFIINNDFTNKTIATFGTSASSSYNNSRLIELNESAETWLDPRRFSSRVDEGTVIERVNSII